MSRWLRPLLVALATTPPLVAQGRPPVPPAIAALATRLQADATLPDSLPRLSAGDLLGPQFPRNVRYLPDPGVLEFIGVVADVWRSAPSSVCLAILREETESGYDTWYLLAAADPGLADRYAQVLEAMIRGMAGGLPGGSVATRAALREGMIAAIGGLPAADQQRMARIAQNPPATPEDLCWTSVQTLTSLTGLPPGQQAPVVRAMFAGPADR